MTCGDQTDKVLTFRSESFKFKSTHRWSLSTLVNKAKIGISAVDEASFHDIKARFVESTVYMIQLPTFAC